MATIDEIAANLEADRDTVLREALTMYLANYEELKADIEEAERQLNAGESHSHEEVLAWLESQHRTAKKFEAA